MKKLVKIGSVLTMAGTVLLSSGCSCGVKQSKINERSQATMESSLDYSKNFTVTHKVKQTQKQSDDTVSVKEYVYVMTRDADNNSVEYTATVKAGKEGEDLVENQASAEKIKLYQQGGIVYISINENAPMPTDYSSTYYAAIDTATLVSSKVIKYDYDKLFGSSYDTYKVTPYHACAEGGDITQVPEILSTFAKTSLTCKAKKKLFGKDTTYTINYRVSVGELRELVIKTDKENNIISVYGTNKIAVSGQEPVTEVIEFTVA